MPLEDYELLSKISYGRYSMVYKVRRTTDQQLFALKKVPLLQMEFRSKKNALTEVKLLQTYKHPNIISLIQICYDSEQGHLCLILEYSQRGDLASEIKRRTHKNEPFKENQLWSILYQISKGLLYLHQKNILHRDLKPSNILLFSDGVAKIADLNVSTSYQNLSYTRTGTLTYTSPQIWKGQVYDSKCDIWSLGCLTYEMAALHLPFQAENMEKLYKNIIKCNYDRLTQSYNREFRDLVSFMIQINSKLRPTAKTICKMCFPHCNSQREKNRLYSLTPYIESKFRLKPLQINFGSSQYNFSRPVKKQKMKRLVIKSQKLRQNSPKYLFDLDYQFEKQLKNTEQIKDYICNKLMKNNLDNPLGDDEINNLNKSSIYKRILKHPKKQERVIQTRQRRHTEI